MIGNAEPVKNMSANRILKRLQILNPDRYDLPTENQIKTVVKTLITDDKKKRVKEAKEAKEAADAARTVRAASVQEAST